MKRFALILAIASMAGFGIAQAERPANPEIPPSESNPGTRPANNPVTTPLPASTTPFETVDKNGDGSVSQTELDGAHLQGMTLARVDTDKDGQISRTEWSTQQQKDKAANQRK